MKLREEIRKLQKGGVIMYSICIPNFRPYEVSYLFNKSKSIDNA